MPIKLSILFFAFTSLVSCKSGQLIHSSTSRSQLFKVVVLYPNGDGRTFDIEYYERKHMPMVAGFLGKNLKFYEIDKGISGRTPNEKVPFLAVGNFYVWDVAEYNKAIGQNRDAVLSDLKNYTNIQPIIQISEVKHIGFNNEK